MGSVNDNGLLADRACVVPPARFERATLGLEVLCSIQLSYGGRQCEAGSLLSIHERGYLRYRRLIIVATIAVPMRPAAPINKLVATPYPEK